MQIGIALKRIRIQLTVPQKELAAKCGLASSTLSQIENGQTNPSEEALNKICAALEIPKMLVYIVALDRNSFAEHKEHHVLYSSLMSLMSQLIDPRHQELLLKIKHEQKSWYRDDLVRNK